LNAYGKKETGLKPIEKFAKPPSNEIIQKQAVRT